MLRYDAIPASVRELLERLSSAPALETFALAGGTKLDFLRHAYPLLEPLETVDGVRLLSVPDVAAMKLNAIANRGSKKDFFDLCELAEVHSLSTMLEFFERKYRNTDRFIVLRSLAWFEDADQEPDPVSLSGLFWEQVKAKVSALLRELG